ncbi:MAG: hypothetical protein A2X48_04540 [Lentisphaerae bacterium GWF2_49_21]|nr:MAG: hypothetical protein A2X48_04540 [Lentisphaerae bacterium GWF2_49_21]
MLTLKDILEIENTSDILDYRCPGTDYVIWPYMRSPVMRMLIYKLVFPFNSFYSNRHVDDTPCKIIMSTIDGLFHGSCKCACKEDIVLLCNGINNIKNDGKYFNRMSDYFAECFPEKTLVLENPYLWRNLRPRYINNVAPSSPFIALSLAFGRLPHKSKDIKAAADFTSYISNRILELFKITLEEDQLKFLSTSLTRHMTRLKYELGIYRFILRRISPKIVIFEDASYGRIGHLVRLAKSMGIKTAEMQHGLVSRGHYPYNYADTILESKEYKEYLPDYFLSYGDWWKSQINLPSEIVPVGNPHLDAMTSKRKIDIQNSILVLSDGEKFEDFLGLAKEIDKLSTGYKVKVRPHPVEREKVFNLYGASVGNIIVDHNDNLYDTLSKSYAVIGEYSTALYEATCYTNNVFIRDNIITSFFLPDAPFKKFKGIDDLSSMLSSNIKLEQKYFEGMWAENWKDRYSSFISKTINKDI